MRPNDPKVGFLTTGPLRLDLQRWPALVAESIDAWATLAMATLTCSTAVDCCLVESPI
jgi:hypothetical protein